jgi:hypothetical protein
MMLVGWYKPVHVKTLVSQNERMLLMSRKLLRDKTARRAEREALTGDDARQAAHAVTLLEKVKNYQATAPLTKS